MLSRNRELLCISRVRVLLQKRTAGGVSIYLLVIMFMMFFLLLFKAALDKQRLYVTYDAVDDALVSSLIAASPINVREYGKSGQLVIYDDVTKPPVVGIGAVVQTDEQKADKFLNSTDLLSPATDSFLNNALNIFMKSLQVNLKLDSAMNATISGIDGQVEVTEFSVYNMFEYFDKNGNRLHYRFIRYTYDGIAWSSVSYPIDMPVYVFNSFDDRLSMLDSTSVAANLSFTVKVTENNGWVGGPTTTRQINYQRLVDITD